MQRFADDFYALPAAAKFGEVYDRDRARGLSAAHAGGCVMAAQVLACGLDFSFAPVLDCGNPKSNVIGDRAFHSSPPAIAELGAAFIAGMRAAGMPATAKHFPGHGAVAADSHHELPVDCRDYAAVQTRDLQPFAALAEQLAAVMTAHISFPQIDPDLPTYSKFWLQKILRQRLNFQGVIFSDDLTMQAAATADPATAATAALTAGCDMTLICNAPKTARATADKLAQNYPTNQTRLLSMHAQPTTITDDEINEMIKTLQRIND